MKKLQKILRKLRVNNNISKRIQKWIWAFLLQGINYSRIEKIASCYALSVYKVLALGVDGKEKELQNQLLDKESIKNLEKLLLKTIELLEELNLKAGKKITQKKSRPN